MRAKVELFLLQMGIRGNITKKYLIKDELKILCKKRSSSKSLRLPNIPDLNPITGLNKLCVIG